MFVVVLGAAPSIANGLINGVDHIPPSCCGPGGCWARRASTPTATSILPAALPTFVAGLKQGWAFAWRSLMAGELHRRHREQGRRSASCSRSTATSSTARA